jgi:23S rRNA (guanosine2251-2'-O)-methyltransferase
MTKLNIKERNEGLIIGRNPVQEMIKFSPKSIHKIIILHGLTDKKIKLIEDESKQNNIAVEIQNKTEFQKLFDSTNKSEGISQGIIAVAEEYKYASEKDMIEINIKKENSVILLLDEIQDPHNLGAIIRTASAAGIDSMLLTAKNTAKVNHTVMKTSSGAANFIRIALTENVYKTIENLKKSGFYIIGTGQNAAENLYSFKFPAKCLIIFGNEGEGMRKNVSKLCDVMLKIPIRGKINSLNVSVSAGIVLYELIRQTY